jgi:DNA uptake protein ComE-like DNA-binding protein
MQISKRNKRGLIAVLFIGLLVSYAPRVVSFFYNDLGPTVSFEELDEVEKDLVAKKDQRQEARSRSNKKKSRFNRPATSFDPNEYSKEDWMALGLSEKQTDVVLKFTQRGVRSNDDLRKIFVLPDALFELIKDSTVYPATEVVSIEDVDEAVRTIEINSASSEELRSLKGIGDYYSKKIIEYRTQLGGFVSIDQWMDIWNFKKETIESNHEFVTVDVALIERLNINEATIEQLKAHPYISYKVANSIVKMRQVNGEYKKVDEILRSKLINLDLFEKIEPYLKVEK